MKLNEKALEAAAQAAWEDWTVIDGSFRQNAAHPDAGVTAWAAHISAYLEALDTEGLADLYDYWCERIEALPVPDEIRKGDVVACSVSGVWYAVPAADDYAWSAPYQRVLRRAPRQWKIGDLVDDTRDLPGGAVVRDEAGNVAVYAMEPDAFSVAGIESSFSLGPLSNPRIIWLPEEGEK